jgi:phage regulator Rha-like protein
MKQTAIQISMINNINNSDNNGEQLMTSLEIAALTGKKHCHVMEAIRKMELTENRYRYVHGLNGRRKQESYLVWTDEGREFIKEMVY